MKEVGVFEGKTIFSALIDAAEHGESTTITKRGKPVARIVPIESRKPSDGFGIDRGVVTIADDFNATPADFDEYV